MTGVRCFRIRSLHFGRDSAMARLAPEGTGLKYVDSTQVIISFFGVSCQPRTSRPPSPGTSLEPGPEISPTPQGPGEIASDTKTIFGVSDDLYRSKTTR